MKSSGILQLIFAFALATNPGTCLVAQTLGTTQSISQFGITWTFDREYEYGQFANGDYWVIGPVVITRIEPDVIVNDLPGGGVGYNHGWEVNPRCTGYQGFDVGAWASSVEPYLGFDVTLVPPLPYTAQPGSSVVKAISRYPHSIVDLYSVGPALQTAAVLTVLGNIPPGGGGSLFRPPYVGTEKPFYSTADIQTGLLPQLAPVGAEPTLAWVESYFQRMRVEHTGGRTGRIIRPAENYLQFDGISYMPQEAGKVHDGLLRLLLNDPIESKMKALIYAIQTGIDEFHAMKNGNQWGAIIGEGGGYEIGHKALILFAGYMLGSGEVMDAVQAADFFQEDLFVWRSPSSNTVLWGGEPPHGSWKTWRDPHGWIDSPSGAYQQIHSGPYKGSVTLMSIAPGLISAWGCEKFSVLAEYVDRYVTVGRWYQPDPFAEQRTIPYPYTGYETQTGILIPRFAHGSDADYHHYSSSFQKNMYDAYRHATQAQCFSLLPGWNWISFNVLPADRSLNSVFAGILGRVEQVKSQGQSAIHSGGQWLGDLSNMEGIRSGMMYKVKVNDACTLTVTGIRIASATPISLAVGWNWVAFYPSTLLPIDQALASIAPQVQQAKSQTQSAIFSSGQWLGDLLQMASGKGYCVLMTVPASLIYPSSGGG